MAGARQKWHVPGLRGGTPAGRRLLVAVVMLACASVSSSPSPPARSAFAGHGSSWGLGVSPTSASIECAGVGCRTTVMRLRGGGGNSYLDTCFGRWVFFCLVGIFPTVLVTCQPCEKVQAVTLWFPRRAPGGLDERSRCATKSLYSDEQTRRLSGMPPRWLTHSLSCLYTDLVLLLPSLRCSLYPGSPSWNPRRKH